MKKAAAGGSYSPGFYRQTSTRSMRAAEKLIPILKGAVAPASVVDFGCGEGGWLAKWAGTGLNDFLGLDRSDVLSAALKVPRSHFREWDLRRPVRLGRKFDLVQSIEVAEHLPESVAEQHVESLVTHGDAILFSAAVPGQGGEGHIHEKPVEYWRELFAGHGFLACDLLRPRIHSDRSLEPWYRFHILLYVRDESRRARSLELERAMIDRSERLPSFESTLFRLRCRVVRMLPRAWVDRIARLRSLV